MTTLADELELLKKQQEKLERRIKEEELKKKVEMINLDTLRNMNEGSREYLNNTGHRARFQDVRTQRIVHFSTCSKFEVICEILNKQEKKIMSLEEKIMQL
tara:strand:- start:472 stop:774 length:303 start_codon:yes stop_codon:yes gene_type:complete